QIYTLSLHDALPISIADLVVRDLSDRRDQQRMRALQPRVALDISPANPRTDMNCLGSDLDFTQALNSSQVDQQSGSSQTKSHGGDEALPARERLGIALREQRNRFGE